MANQHGKSSKQKVKSGNVPIPFDFLMGKIVHINPTDENRISLGRCQH